MSDASYGADAPHDEGENEQPPTVFQLPGGATVSLPEGSSLNGTINGVPVNLAEEHGTVGAPGDPGYAEIQAGETIHINAPAPSDPPEVFAFTGQDHGDGDGDDIWLYGGNAAGTYRGGDVILCAGSGGDAGEDGKVVVLGDLHVQGDIVKIASYDEGQGVTLASGSTMQCTPLILHTGSRELMRVEADGEVAYGDPLTKEELSVMASEKPPSGFMDGTSVVLSIVVSELARVREELERLRSRVG